MQLDLVAFLTSFSCVFNNYFSCLHNYVAYLACLRRYATTVINSVLTYLGLLPLLGHRPPTSCLHTTRSCAVFSSSFQFFPVLLTSASKSLLQLLYGLPLFLFTWGFHVHNSKVSLNSKSLQLNHMNCFAFNSIIMPIVI